MLTLVIELFQKVAKNSSSQKCLLWLQVSSPWTSLNRFRVAQYHIAAPSFRTRLYIGSTAIEWRNHQILPCSPSLTATKAGWQTKKRNSKLIFFFCHFLFLEKLSKPTRVDSWSRVIYNVNEKATRSHEVELPTRGVRETHAARMKPWV